MQYIPSPRLRSSRSLRPGFSHLPLGGGAEAAPGRGLFGTWCRTAAPGRGAIEGGASTLGAGTAPAGRRGTSFEPKCHNQARAEGHNQPQSAACRTAASRPPWRHFFPGFASTHWPTLTQGFSKFTLNLYGHPGEPNIQGGSLYWRIAAPLAATPRRVVGPGGGPGRF